MLDYKKLAFKHFKRSNFDDAMMYFSLAFEKSGDENLLFYISLCSYAKISKDEAKTLFEMFRAKEQLNANVEGLDDLLKMLESRINESEILAEQNAISYEDFMKMVRNDNFKNVFENIMFSTRVMISNKDDFLEFISNLIKSDFLDMSINYIESAAAMFGGDERIDGLLNQIKQRKQA
ncbi:hypothetical protein LMG7974_00504 [Campylobacter majalis]|uniref:Histidine kinase n=1 Tax=Campylobacter majalis TaxID=2790656 RepID=A0ABN7K685_9BACT|nr:histidine kinase [Campylobacter majalis]CAD7287625.1 hypothetical protein LMG7974_00504 [Campylobacter majalis]